MGAERAAILCFCVILLALVLRCAGTGAPGGWLPDAKEAQQEAYGAWISIEYRNGSSDENAQGELIAIRRDSLFVLTQTLVQDTLIAVAADQVSHGRLATCDANHMLLVGWTAGGLLTTPSHGWFLALSVPLWIITGTVAAIGQSYVPIEKLPVESWKDLRKFARFPQGLPEGLDRRTLRGKWK